MQEHTITAATKYDYRQLINLWELSVRATHHFLTEADILRYKYLIVNEYFDQVDLYKIHLGDTIVGFLGLSEDNIQMLFIHPDFRGKGFGKALVKFSVVEKNALHVDVNEQNVQALEFYKLLGFYVVERYDQDAAGKPYPILSLKLNALSSLLI